MHVLLLQAIVASWKSLPLDMVEYKATSKLRSTEDIFSVLEENSVMLSTMKVCVGVGVWVWVWVWVTQVGLGVDTSVAVVWVWVWVWVHKYADLYAYSCQCCWCHVQRSQGGATVQKSQGGATVQKSQGGAIVQKSQGGATVQKSQGGAFVRCPNANQSCNFGSDTLAYPCKHKPAPCRLMLDDMIGFGQNRFRVGWFMTWIHDKDFWWHD